MESCVHRMERCAVVFARGRPVVVVVRSFVRLFVCLRGGLTSFVCLLDPGADARVRGIRRRLVGVVHRGGRSTEFGE